MDSSINTLLRGSRLVGRSSEPQSAVRVERRIVDPVEREEEEFGSHFALLWGGEPTIAEREYRAGRFRRVVKRPGTLSLGSAGRLPAVRPWTAYDVTVGVIDPNIAQRVLEELNDKRAYRMHEQLGVEDDPLAHLIRLLSAEDQAGGESGRLYRQSLEQAFVARFLHVAGSEGVAAPGVSPLPIPALRRLIEKFEGEYERNLSLDELAKEAGYSRSHFQKMFREATGKSAFAYLRDLRLEKARLALEETDDDIASIAARVGFSSHSHLTKLFARRFGVSPSRYRRER